MFIYECVCLFSSVGFFQKFDQFFIIESSLSTYAEQVCIYILVYNLKQIIYDILGMCFINIFLIQLQLQIIQLQSGKEMKRSVRTLSKYSSKSRIIAPFYTVYMCSIQLYRADLACQFSRTVEGTIFVIFIFISIYEKLCALREMYSIYVCAMEKILVQYMCKFLVVCSDLLPI